MGTPSNGAGGGGLPSFPGSGAGGLQGSIMDLINKSLGSVGSGFGSMKGQKNPAGSQPKNYGLPSLDKVPGADPANGFNPTLTPDAKSNLLQSMIARARGGGGTPPAPAAAAPGGVVIK